jgi:hypothetical protein
MANAVASLEKLQEGMSIIPREGKQTNKGERRETNEGRTHCNIWSNENSGDMSILSSVVWRSNNEKEYQHQFGNWVYYFSTETQEDKECKTREIVREKGATPVAMSSESCRGEKRRRMNGLLM